MGRICEGRVSKWGDRQFQSDTSAERQRRYRDRKKEESDVDNSRDNATVTSPSRHGDAPETETETERGNLKVSCPEPAKPTRTRHEYPEEFETGFWGPYPTDPNMSKSEALKQWKRLSVDDRKAASESVPAFVAFCKSDPTYRPIHADRYLAKRRFDGFAKQASQSSKMVFLKVGSPEYNAWNSYFHDRHGKSAPQHNGGWRFPTAWPPSHQGMTQ